MFCSLLILTVVISGCGRWLAGAGIAPAPTVTPPPEAGDVLLSAALEAPATVDSGEPLPLTFTLTNNSDVDLYVLTWLTPFEGIANEIFHVKRDGAILPYEGPLVMRGDPTEEDYLSLDAGASASATVDLAPVYDLSEPGAYTIAFTAALQDVAGSKDAMARRTADLKQIVIPANTVTVTVTSTASENPGPGSDRPGTTSDEGASNEGASNEGTAGMARYVNEDYGFTFQFPATWTLEEAGEQMVMLTQGGLRLAIAFQAPGSDPPRQGGLPAGELKTVGTMVFMGEEIDKQAVVHQGKVKVLLCDARAGDLFFAFRLDDVITADYEAVNISEGAELDMAAILASFELLADTEPAASAITGMVQDVSLSARIITLTEPVQGFDTIALADGCEVIFVGGGGATLRDLRPGAKIEAQGQPGSAQAFLANRLLISNDES
jgi:hypothetical protein